MTDQIVTPLTNPTHTLTVALYQCLDNNTMFGLVEILGYVGNGNWTFDSDMVFYVHNCALVDAPFLADMLDDVGIGHNLYIS